MALFTDLSDLLECPVCYETLRPPIWQCAEGHTICDTCKDRLKACPSCRIFFHTLSRNRALEEVMRRTHIPCKYTDLGCDVKLSLDEIIKHETKCCYHPVSCPHYHGWRHKICQWTGPSITVVKHLIKAHAVSVISLPNTQVTGSIQRVTNSHGHVGADWGPFLYLYKDRYFLLEFFHIAKDKDYRGALRSIQGNHEGLAYYQIEVRRHYRRLLWEGVVRPIGDNPIDIMVGNDCFTIKENLAIFFSENDCLGTEGLEKLECDIRLRISLNPFTD